MSSTDAQNSKGLNPCEVFLSDYQYKGYHPLNDKIILYSDNYEKNYFAAQFIPYAPGNQDQEPNFYFNREIALYKQVNKDNLPFVPLVKYIPPTPEYEGLIFTKFMRGSSLMHQIKIQKTANQPSKSTKYSLLNLEKIDSPFDDFEDDFSDHPIKASKSIIIEDFKYNNANKMINIYGISVAVSVLQKLNIMHRDIRPENILLDENCKPYLSDFGLARKVIGKQQMSGIRGTSPYIALEMFTEERKADISSDIFSLGVTMIMILQGEVTINDDSGRAVNAYTLKQPKLVKLLKQKKYNLPTNIPESLNDLIDRCLNVDPDQRPKIGDILDVLVNDQVIAFGGNEYKEYIEEMRSKLQ